MLHMFRSALDQHAERRDRLKAQKDQHQAAAQLHAGRFAAHVAQHLDKVVHQIYENQLEIERQSKAVKDELACFQANARELGALVRQVNLMLREVGDFENYLEVVEEQTQRLAQGRRQEPQQEQPQEQPQGQPHGEQRTQQHDQQHSAGHTQQQRPQQEELPKAEIEAAAESWLGQQDTPG